MRASAQVADAPFPTSYMPPPVRRGAAPQTSDAPRRIPRGLLLGGRLHRRALLGRFGLGMLFDGFLASASALSGVSALETNGAS